MWYYYAVDFIYYLNAGVAILCECINTLLHFNYIFSLPTFLNGITSLYSEGSTGIIKKKINLWLTALKGATLVN